MQIKIKRVLAIALVMVLFCGTLCSCSIEKADVVGVWTRTTTTNTGATIVYTMTIDDDGTYSIISTKNGFFYESSTGTYTIDGRKVKFTDSKPYSSTVPYTYKRGKLVNGKDIQWDRKA